MSGRELYKIMIKNDLDFVIDKIIEKNNDLTIKELKIEELEKEIERLNNIINELEKEIISQIEICKEGQVLEAKVRSPFDTYSGDIRAYKYLLYKLKELKDSD